MVIDRVKETIKHEFFFDLGRYFSASDTIFYNATRVEERRAYLTRTEGGKIFECVFLKQAPNPGRKGWTWRVLMRNIRRLSDGTILRATKDATYEFTLYRDDEGVFLACNKPLTAADFARIGEMPIPPYMKRAAGSGDSETYQNYFKDQIAQKEKIQGSAATPTAALHFTPALHQAMRETGVAFYPVCLDIGYGTFAPLTEENFTNQRLHSEHYYIPPETKEKFTTPGGRKIVLGTTALRALLSFQKYGLDEGDTEIFVQPGDLIAGIDGLITNFHLPQSSLILLTAAFCGEKLLMRAYAEAIAHGYRFYSYGDAMLIL